ncbi:MAG: hypothetical protein QJR04_25255 [Burkholderia multivorans]|nr:hypothetical protein [Burkholderia multivorans]
MPTIELFNSPAWTDSSKKAIRCMVKFTEFPEPIPFVAMADDPEPHGRDLFARLVAGEGGVIAEPPAPPKTTPGAANVVA